MAALVLSHNRKPEADTIEVDGGAFVDFDHIHHRGLFCETALLLMAVAARRRIALQ
jgi:hypothetical protein